MKALFPLVMVAALGLTSCLEEEVGPSQEEYDYLQDEKDMLKEDLKKAYLELDEFDAKFEIFEELEEKAKSADEKVKELEELQESKKAVEEEMRKLREEYEAYQKKYEAKVRNEAEGEEFASIEAGGRTLKSVVISSVSESAVKVRHADGFATLDSGTAPQEWKERFFLRSEDEIAQRAAELALFLNPPAEVEEDGAPEREISSYQQRRLDREKQEDALKTLGSEVEKAIVSVSGSTAQGSGFFAQDGITTYLYTAASLLDANPGLKIVDMDGREWKNFGELEVAEDGGLVRLAVTEPVEHHLELRPQGEEVPSNTLAAAFSLAQGATSVTKADCKIRSPRGGRYDISTSLQQLLGGPLVTSDVEVIGLISQDVPVRRDIWGTDSRQSRVIQFASRLDVALKWQKSSLGGFLTARDTLAQFDRTTQLIAAMGALRPSVEGLNLDARVGGSATVRSVFQDNKDLNVVSQVMRIEKDFTGSKMKVSERDLNKKFRSIYETILRGAQDQTLTAGDFSPFHLAEVEVSLEARKDAVLALNKALSSVRE